MKYSKKLLFIPFILLILAAILIFLSFYSSSKEINIISGSGTIEAKEVSIASQATGRILSLKVEEGDSVKAGQIIAEIDHSKLDIQLQQALVNLKSSEVRLDQAKLTSQIIKTQTQVQIKQAKAMVDASMSHLAQAEIGLNIQESTVDTQIQQAEAELAKAITKLDQAQDIYKFQQEQSKSQIDLSEASLKLAMTRLSIAEKGAREQEINVAESMVEQSKANYANAKSNLERMQNLYSEGVISKQQLELAQLQHDVSNAQYKSAQEQFNLIKAGSRDEEKEAARAQVDQANIALEMAKSSMIQNAIKEKDIETAKSILKQAESSLAMAKVNALSKELRREDIEVAKANVLQAKGALEIAEANTNQIKIQDQNTSLAEAQLLSNKHTVELLQSQIKDAFITSPISGTVTTKTAEEGEFATPGMTIAVIANLDVVYLTIFISEAQLGKVKLGQDAQISVDSFHNRTFNGKVIYISPEAEFTPKNIQTKEERLKLVYGIKIEIKNTDGSLKPGMPADAVLKF